MPARGRGHARATSTKLAERHGFQPRARRLDRADAAAPTTTARSTSRRPGRTRPGDAVASSSTRSRRRRRARRRARVDGKLAHAVAALALNAYRAGGGALPDPCRRAGRAALRRGRRGRRARGTRRSPSSRSPARARCSASSARSRRRRRSHALPGPGRRLRRSRSRSRSSRRTSARRTTTRAPAQGLGAIEAAFFGIAPAPPRAAGAVFTDTYDELNGVAGTMRRLAGRGRGRQLRRRGRRRRRTRPTQPGP